MTVQEIRILIDIQIADICVSDNLNSNMSYRPALYLAIDDARRIRTSKTYNDATQRNSIDFLNHLMEHIPIPIHIIRTDYSLLFQRDFEKQLEKLGLRHERVVPMALHE